MLLDELSGIKSKQSDNSAMILNTVFFIYLSTMMPAYAFEHLNKTVSKALNALEAGEQPLRWLYTYKKDIPLYVSAMKAWQGEASKIFTSQEIVRNVFMNMGENKYSNPQFFDNAKDGNCLNEKQLYVNAAILYPSRDVLKKHDPQFLALLEKHQSDLFRDHLIKHWHFNTTLMDVSWYSDIPRDEFDVGFDPFATLDHFPSIDSPSKPKHPSQLYDHFAPFLIDVSSAIKHLDGRFQMEAVLGDYTDVAEKLQFGLYGDDNEGRPKDFPTAFERIHLSNVP